MALKKAGVIIDRWKLPIFERRFKDAGFTYENKGEIAADVLSLMVEVPDGTAQRLAQVILAAQTEAARTKK
jgi:hypothetical protein